MFPEQVSQLQQQRNLPLIRKLVVEIALQERNAAIIAAVVAANKSHPLTGVAIRVADNDRWPAAWQNMDLEFDLMISGEVTIVLFEVKKAGLKFDLDSLDLCEDDRGRLQIKRIAGPVLKK